MILTLTEEQESPGTGASVDAAVGDWGCKSTIVVAVGTDIVDQDGKDIESQGRMLLFDMKKRKGGAAVKVEHAKKLPKTNGKGAGMVD